MASTLMKIITYFSSNSSSFDEFLMDILLEMKHAYTDMSTIS